MVVYGGRKYANKTRLFTVLDDVHSETPVTLVIEGDAPGADRLAKYWAQKRRVKFDPYPADWSDLQAQNAVIRKRPDGSFYNANAGNDRNLLMMNKGKPDIAVEFNGGFGTRNMRHIVIREMTRRPLRYIRVIDSEWRLIRVTAPHFVAGFETDGKTVRIAAPILKRVLLGKSEDEARAIIAAKGWKASVLAPKGDGQPEE